MTRRKWIASLRMPEGGIVCNSGPLIALSKVGCLHLLGSLYDRVVIPDGVYLSQRLIERACREAGENLPTAN